jgi:hypothetical protein
MVTPAAFSQILHRDTGFHAAWYPIANVWSVGDVGVVSDGVLVRTGSIKDYGVTFETGAGSPVKGLDFKSEGTKVRNFVGDAQVNVLPTSDVDARLEVEFTRTNSFMLKAAQLDVVEMVNIDAVVSRLAQLKDRRWRRQYRVVHATASGTAVTFVSAREAGTTFEVHGTANGLQQLNVGQAQADLKLTSSGSLGLNFVGDSGMVGLRMFQLRPWRGGTRFMGLDEQALEVQDDFGPDLIDDV